MGKRVKWGKSYMERRKNGKFKDFTRIGKSLAADRRKKAMRVSKPGYGNRGDQLKDVEDFIKSL